MTLTIRINRSNLFVPLCPLLLADRRVGDNHHRQEFNGSPNYSLIQFNERFKYDLIISALLSLAHRKAQGFNQTRPHSAPKLFIWSITPLIRAFTLSFLSNNTKRWLSAYLKGLTASCYCNLTSSPSFHARVGFLSGRIYILYY